jgi:hypothetical protein
MVKMTNRKEFFRLIKRFNKIGSLLPGDFDPNDPDQRTDVKMLSTEMRKLETAIKEFKPCQAITSHRDGAASVRYRVRAPC